jgi:hypothetical protein
MICSGVGKDFRFSHHLHKSCENMANVFGRNKVVCKKGRAEATLEGQTCPGGVAQ